MKALLGAALAVMAWAVSAAERYETYTLQGTTNATWIDVPEYQTVHYVTNFYWMRQQEMWLHKNGMRIPFTGIGICRGPARIEWATQTDYDRGLLTLKFTEEIFPAGQTVLIPAEGGARIIMESSPDLITWTNASPGTYTNATGNLFFRIRAQRVASPAPMPE